MRKRTGVLGEKTSRRDFTRRDFLKTTAVAAAALSAPVIVPASVFGANAPSNRINLATIGYGNQGWLDLRSAWVYDDVQVVAVCDVNRESTGYKEGKQTRGRDVGVRDVNEHYAERMRSGRFKGCDGYNDFRDVLARSDVDAVIIVVPDQWHAVMTILAAQAGKDIYCEKPLTLTIREGRAMIQAVRRNNVVLQCGSHERSKDARTRHYCELVRNGYIGKLQTIRTTVGKMNAYLVGAVPEGAWKPDPVPEGFDYEMWLGPAPWAPYHRDRCFYTFRFGWDYSGGQTTNYGAHSNDMAQWGGGYDGTGPVEIENVGGVFPKDGLFTTPSFIHFRAVYADGVELICKTGDTGVQTKFEGTEGWVTMGYKEFDTFPKSLQNVKIKPGEIRLYESTNHMRNFLDCIKSRGEPAAPVEFGHTSANVCHLGNIAMLLNRKLRWDPKQEVFIGDDEANRLLSRPMRAPWHL